MVVAAAASSWPALCFAALQDGAAGPLERRRARWSAPGLRVEMIGCGGRPARRPWGEEVFFKPLFILKSQSLLQSTSWVS